MKPRDRVVAEALSWVGTPYHHAARVKGVGVDCAQLVIAVYVAAGLLPDLVPAAYPADWFLHRDTERLLEHVTTHCEATATVAPGDLVTFRFGRAVSHIGIVTAADEFVHAYARRGVLRDRLDVASDRFAGAFTLRDWSRAIPLAAA